jgi:hypothetical protein
MGVWLALMFFVLAGFSGTGVYATMEKINNYEKAIAGTYYLLPPTEREITAWEEKDRKFEIRQKQEEINMLKQGKKTDDLDFIVKQTDDLIAHTMTYPRGHNPPPKEIMAMINVARTERNYYAIGMIGLFGLSVIIYRRSIH